MKQENSSLSQIEQDVIGAMFCDNANVAGAFEIISVDDFTDVKHKRIVEAVFQAFTDGEEIDFVTVGEKTQQRSYIVGCMEHVETGTRLLNYAKALREKSLRRLLVTELNQYVAKLKEGEDPANVLDSLQQKLFDLDRSQSSTMRWIKEATEDDFKNSAGISTGFADLQWLKLERGALTIVGGRPSMGKTALCLKIALNVAKTKIPVLIFSMEMSFKQIVHRVASMDFKCKLIDIRNGKTTREDFKKTLENPILVDDSGTITPAQLRTRTRTAIQKHGVGLVVIDYLQMMSSATQLGEYEKITEISGGIKSVAKDLDIPIIAACQLNRMLEDKGVNSKKPTMAHLRGSGAIEQDADVVIFPYRPHVYEKGKHGDSEAEIIVGKNRNGQTDDGVKVVWLKDYALFESLNPDAEMVER